MRISTDQMHSTALSSILDLQSKLLETQRQLSTGKRINSPSDDPAGAKSVLELDQALASADQFKRNADTAQGRLSAEDVALTSIVDALQRARELAVNGNNDTVGADGRTAIAVEVRGLLDSVLSLANTQDANGEYLFAGFQSNATPFTQSGGSVSYNGDQGQRYVQVDQNRQIAVGDSGQDVFMTIPNTSKDAFAVLQDLADSMDANNPDPTSINEIDAVMTHILNVQGKIGARQNALDGQQNLNQERILQLTSLKSDIEDLDFAKAVSTLQLQLTGLQAAQNSYAQVQGLSLFQYI